MELNVRVIPKISNFGILYTDAFIDYQGRSFHSRYHNHVSERYVAEDFIRADSIDLTKRSK